MSPEKQPAGLGNKRQKIIIGVIVVLVLMMLWMLFGGSGGGTEPTPVTPTVASNAIKPAATPSGSMTSVAPKPATPTVLSSQPKQALIPANAELLKMQQQTQTEYIASLNKLQMLKLQKEIDETKTAIATAELNRMTAEKSIADLITTKTQQPAEIIAPPAAPTQPPSSSINPSVGPPTTLTPPPPIAVEVKEFPYQILSVAYQGRKWSAVINAGPGRLYNVTVGDVLPPDNSKVIAINKKGVTLKRKTTTRVLSLTSTM